MSCDPRLLGEKGGEPPCFAIREEERVLHVSRPSTLSLAHPIALVAAHDAGPALDLHEINSRGAIASRSTSVIDLSEAMNSNGKHSVGVVIRERLVEVVQRLPFPRELRRVISATGLTRPRCPTSCAPCLGRSAAG